MMQQKSAAVEAENLARVRETRIRDGVLQNRLPYTTLSLASPDKKGLELATVSE